MNSQDARAAATLWTHAKTPFFERLIWRGKVENDSTERWVVAEVQAGESPRELRVGFVRSSKRARTFFDFARALRSISLTAAAIPMFVVLALGMLLGKSAQVPAFVLALLGALLLQSAVNLLNDVEDYTRLFDRPGTLGGSGVLADGTFSAIQLRAFAWLLLVVSVLCGAFALALSPLGPAGFLQLAFASCLCLALAYGYSSKPFEFKYRALGDAVVFLLCGPLLTAMTSLVVFGDADRECLFVGAVFGFAAVAILHANNLQDLQDDKLLGAQTIASLLGERASRVYLAALFVLAYVSLAWVSYEGRTLAAIVTAAPATLLLAPIFRKTESSKIASKEATNLRVLVAQHHLALGLGWLVGLALTAVGVSVFR